MDTKFLHLSDLATGEIGFGDTYGLVRDLNPWEWRWTASANEWRLRVYSAYGSPCGLLDTIPSTFPGTLVDLYGSDRTTCKQFLLDAFVSLSSVVGTVGTAQAVSCPGTFFGSTYTGTPAVCYRVTASEATMDDYLASKVDVFTNWTDQPFNQVTSNYDPSYWAPGFGSQAEQNAAFANALSGNISDSPGQFVDHAVNESGTVPNPLIDFTIPDCLGSTVDACQTAISAAADSADATVSFTVITADTIDPTMARSRVLSTNPAAYTTARPTSVTLTKNRDDGPEANCTSQTDWPHRSQHLNYSMLTVGRITCNFSGSVSFTMSMWKCTSSPQPDLVQLGSGAWGCALAASTNASVTVVKGQAKEVYCPWVDQGAPLVPYDPDKYWIAYTSTPAFSTFSWSQAVYIP